MGNRISSSFIILDRNDPRALTSYKIPHKAIHTVGSFLDYLEKFIPYIGLNPPDDYENGSLWYDLGTLTLKIYFNGEWHKCIVINPLDVTRCYVGDEAAEEKGVLWFDTSLKKLKIHDGNQWNDCILIEIDFSKIIHKGDSPPSDTTQKPLWIDTSDRNILKVYDRVSDQWFPSFTLPEHIDAYTLRGLSPDHFAPYNHNHDDRYYTKSQLQTEGESQVNWENIFNKPESYFPSIHGNERHEPDMAQYDLANVDDNTILEKLKNVDGSGSGLDADLLDGHHASDFALTSHDHDNRYYTKQQLAQPTFGTEVHWDNITNKPGSYFPTTHGNERHEPDMALFDLSNVDDEILLNKLKNVDGSGSGLDADLLDGRDYTAFAPAIHNHELSNLQDVDNSNKGDGKVLVWRDSENKHVYEEVTSGGGTGISLQKLQLSFTVPDDYSTISEVLSFLKENHFFDYVECEIKVNSSVIEENIIVFDNPENHRITLTGLHEVDNITTYINDGSIVYLIDDYSAPGNLFFEAISDETISNDDIIVIKSANLMRIPFYNFKDVGSFSILGVGVIKDKNYSYNSKTGWCVELYDYGNTLSNFNYNYHLNNELTEFSQFDYLVSKYNDVIDCYGIEVKTNCLKTIQNLVIRGYDYSGEVGVSIGTKRESFRYFPQLIIESETGNIEADERSKPIFVEFIRDVVIIDFQTGFALSSNSYAVVESLFVSYCKRGISIVDNSKILAKTIDSSGNEVNLFMANNSKIFLLDSMNMLG